MGVFFELMFLRRRGGGTTAIELTLCVVKRVGLTQWITDGNKD